MRIPLDALCRSFRVEWKRRHFLHYPNRSMTTLNNAVSVALFNGTYSRVVADQRAHEVHELHLPPPYLDYAASVYRLDRAELALCIGDAVLAEQSIKFPSYLKAYWPFPERELPLQQLLKTLASAPSGKHLAVIGDYCTGTTTLVREARRRLVQTHSLDARTPAHGIFGGHLVDGTLFEIALCGSVSLTGLSCGLLYDLRPAQAYPYVMNGEGTFPYGKEARREVFCDLARFGVRNVVIDAIGESFRKRNGSRAMHFARGILAASRATDIRVVLAGSPNLWEAFNLLPAFASSFDVVELPPIQWSEELRQWLDRMEMGVGLGPFDRTTGEDLIGASDGNLLLLRRYAKAAVNAVLRYGVAPSIVRGRLAQLRGMGLTELTEDLPQMTENFIIGGQYVMSLGHG